MRVGITGASGFIGGHLAEYLSRRKDTEVSGLTRTLAPGTLTRDRITWVRGDLASPGDCASFVKDLDVVLHLAHVNTPLTSNRDLASDAALNLVPTLALLQAIRETGRRIHLVYASTGGAIYRRPHDLRPIPEEGPLQPTTSYGILKRTVEVYLRMAANEGWLTACALRIGNAYGRPLPPERLQGFIGVAIGAAAAGRPIRIFGDPRNVRDYVHLDDIARMFELALSPSEDWSVFNVGSGTGTSVAELLQLLQRVVGRDLETIEDESEKDEAALLPQWAVLDCGAAFREFGWRPAVSLEDGLQRLWDAVAE